MNRKTFLATLSALFLSPYMGKSKEPDLIKKWAAISKQETETIIRPDDYPEDQKWVKANPELLRQKYVPDDGFITIEVDGKPIVCTAC